MILEPLKYILCIKKIRKPIVIQIEPKHEISRFLHYFFEDYAKKDCKFTTDLVPLIYPLFSFLIVVIIAKGIFP